MIPFLDTYLVGDNVYTFALAWIALPIETYNFSHGVHPKPDHSFRNVDTLLEPHLEKVESLGYPVKKYKGANVTSIVITIRNEVL